MSNGTLNAVTAGASEVTKAVSASGADVSLARTPSSSVTPAQAEAALSFEATTQQFWLAVIVIAALFFFKLKGK